MGSYLRIKICGITNPADGLQAARLGADAVGLNFYPPSPRFVDLPTAETIVRGLPPFVVPVGVFVNQALEEVLGQTIIPLRRCIQTIQMYGTHPEQRNFFPFRVIPAFAVRDANSLQPISAYLDRCGEFGELPAAILVDAHVSGQYGGTGMTVPWEVLADFHPGVPLILAGGLNPDNVAEAIRIVRPQGVDVASGVEGAPGRKDPDKMRRFIANARAAAAKLGG